MTNKELVKLYRVIREYRAFLDSLLTNSIAAKSYGVTRIHMYFDMQNFARTLLVDDSIKKSKRAIEDAGFTLFTGELNNVIEHEVIL